MKGQNNSKQNKTLFNSVLKKKSKLVLWLLGISTFIFAFQNCSQSTIVSDSTKAQNLTTDVVALSKQYNQADESEKTKLIEEFIAKAEERRASLLELMQTDPAEVLRVAIPSEKQLEMPAEIVEKLEQRMELEGELESIYFDDFENPGMSRLKYELKTPFGQRFELHFAGKSPQLPSGTSVRAHGLLFRVGEADTDSTDGQLALASSDQSLQTLAADGGVSDDGNSITAAALPNTFGEQKTLVILVNFQDQPSTKPWTTGAINDTVFNEVSNFYLENSSGQSWLTGTTLGWYTLPIDSASCDHWAISSEANKAASSDTDLAMYDRYIYIFPRNACGWGGLGTIGGSKTYSWINGTPTLNYIGHELGHNFGLYHSHALDCTEGTLEGTCYSLNYGDTLDIMGNPNAGHFNAFQKDQLGWFNGNSAASILAIDTNGSYDLGAYEFPLAGTPSALKILKDIDPETGYKSWYYVEMRQAEGFDNFLAGNDNVLSGLVIHSGHDGDRNSSHLLDMTPSSSTWYDRNDPALTVGKTFSDAVGGITLSTQWVGASGATMGVSLATTSCSPQTPLLELASTQSDWVAPGTTIEYNLTLSNRDGSNCDATRFDLSTSIPAGWSAALDLDNVTLAPGSSTNLGLTVTSATDAEDGFYNVVITATNSTNTSYKTSASATYVVDNPDVVNSSPVANNDSASTDLNTAVTINALANDSDPDGDSLTITMLSGVDGSATINSDGSITFTPAQGFTGTETFSYTISDGNGGSATANVMVTVIDATPPIVLITSPENSSTVSGSISIQASASDNVAVAKVEFLLNGNFLSSDSTSPYSAPLDTSTLTNGHHKISAQAIDTSGNKSTLSEITVNVDNSTAEPPPPTDSTAPTVIITSPAEGEIVSAKSTITISASATDDVKVSKVEFYVNSSLICSDSTSSYSCSFKTPGGNGKTFIIEARAIDSSGNSASHKIQVSTGSPTSDSGGETDNDGSTGNNNGKGNKK